ncbi:MAG: hypothetical protein A4E53_00775 [Pelotomaculum sp. PtaB.Bin104]|nr:MAG: hypothetical protein A4E53_00775 [Pelotomaculum sp. PtaB.Bin104]
MIAVLLDSFWYLLITGPVILLSLLEMNCSGVPFWACLSSPGGIVTLFAWRCW